MGRMNELSTGDLKFDGETFKKKHDQKRLVGQAGKIFRYMADGHWRTLQDITEEVEEPAASVSAQLRNFRKPSFGSHTVERRSFGLRTSGVFEYRLLIRGP